MEDFLRDAEEHKRTHDEKSESDFSDRIRRELKDTFKFIDKQKARGKSESEITRDIEKYLHKRER